MFTFSKKTQKKFLILFFIFLFHFFSITASSLNDLALHDEHFSQGRVKLSNLKYGFWFFTGWSAGTSLITIPGTIYKLFLFNKKKIGYIEQLSDLIIAQVNLISGVIFCFGGFMLGKPHRPVVNYPLIGKVNPIYLGISYNFFGHVLAPGLVCYYFGKYCQVDKLLEKKKITLFGYLSIHTFYIFYVLIRPTINVISYHNKLRGNKPYNYPSDYPYAPFYGIMGKFCSNSEEESKNSGFFGHKGAPWLQFLFGFCVVIILAYTIFITAFKFLIKMKNKQNLENKEFQKNDY